MAGNSSQSSRSVSSRRFRVSSFFSWSLADVVTASHICSRAATLDAPSIDGLILLGTLFGLSLYVPFLLLPDTFGQNRTLRI